MSMKLAARAVIVDNGELLLVKHPGSDFYALPGGKREVGESLEAALKRELEEEFGIRGVDVGALFCVNEFEYNNDQDRYSLELFFMINNSEIFRSLKEGSHANELEEIRWVKELSDVSLQPEAARPFLEQAMRGEAPLVAYLGQMDT